MAGAHARPPPGAGKGNRVAARRCRLRVGAMECGLAHRFVAARRGARESAGQSVGEGNSTSARRLARPFNLGRHGAGNIATLVGLLGHRRSVMPTAIPTATYRLQLTPDFGFDRAAAVVPYLKALGMTHLYASPFLKARAGSTHGYEIIDHNAFNPELGGEEGFLRLSAALAQADIGLILDFVPNHMGVHYAVNAWWLDMLEWGPKSPHAASFDIEWDTLPERPGGGVLLPILGRAYGAVLENGEIELRYDAREGSFSAWYFEHRMPIGPSRYGEMLSKVVAQAGAADEPAGRRLLELAARYRGPRNP